ncbi:hypothetical protein [Paraburkholderia sp. MM6662-R1]|uniref:hypothetical protein n=1 Tax=Paraburkholderia sp. MM6662-R1 TaxID=2991066 RepID=UPI003D1C01AE
MVIARLKALEPSEKLFYGIAAALLVVGVCLYLLTHQKTVDLAAGAATCSVDAGHTKANADGSVTILKGAIVECDRDVPAASSARFTLKQPS